MLIHQGNEFLVVMSYNYLPLRLKQGRLACS
jgi:hypothetical protein